MTETREFTYPTKSRRIRKGLLRRIAPFAKRMKRKETEVINIFLEEKLDEEEAKVRAALPTAASA